MTPFLPLYASHNRRIRGSWCDHCVWCEHGAVGGPWCQNLCVACVPPSPGAQAEAKASAATADGKALFGDLPMIRSTEITDRRWTRYGHAVARW